MLRYYVFPRIRKKKKQDDISTENRDILDLTSIGSNLPEDQKRKMKPPGMSNRFDYSYSDQIDSHDTTNTIDVQLLGDSADHDIEYATDMFNAKRYVPPDPENDLDSRLEVEMGGKRRGMQSYTEETYYPQSNITTKRNVRWP
ncbi:MAG: hypothetical protein ACRD8W_18155 [Nitrososphaeraceae archaeon]